MVDKKVDDASIDRQQCKLVLKADGKVQLEIKNGGGFFFKALSRVGGAAAKPEQVAGDAPTENPRAGEATKSSEGADAEIAGEWILRGDKWDADHPHLEQGAAS